MAQPQDEDTNFHEHLEASEDREVVFCHECNSQWYRNQYGLVCPACSGEITEIVSEEFDPRPPPPIQRPPTPPGFHGLRGHNPWRASDDSDPEEEDIEEHISHGPGHSVIFTRTVRSSTPLRRQNQNENGAHSSDHVMRDFQSMLGDFMGPQFRPGQAGRSGPEHLFNHDHPPPRVTGATWTFTTGGRAGPRGGQGDQPDGNIDLATLLGGMFGPMGAGVQVGGEPGNAQQPGLPPGLQGLQGLFAALLNPANARAGDAVYTQEALDNIISQLMEQNPSSNAPGPASASAIASLPKKNLDEKMLGPEGKGECSVCMDDVTIGDEVVVLPCSHWFHEQCAQIWLNEHNTCPICRKGIDESSSSSQPSGAGSGPSSSQGQGQSYNQSAPPLPPNRPTQPQGNGRLNGANRSVFMSMSQPPRTSRNAERLQSIRNAGNRAEYGEAGRMQYQVVGDGHNHRRPDESSAQRRTSYRRDTDASRPRQERERRGSDQRPDTERRNSDRDRDRPRGVSRRSTSSSQSQTQPAWGNGAIGTAFSWMRDRIAGPDNAGGSGSGSSSRRN